MRMLTCFVWLALAGQCIAQRVTVAGFGGSGNDSSNAILADSSGGTWIAGTASSFDLPLLHPAQASNRGTSLIYTTDSGATWQPLRNFSTAPVLATDPRDPNTFYAGVGTTVFKTVNGGRDFTPVTISAPVSASLTDILVDPSNSKTLYASLAIGVWKSVDGGATWNISSTGLPDRYYIGSLTIDPFHPRTLWVWAGVGGFVSTNGGESWSTSSLQLPAGDSAGGPGIRFVFDPVKPGVLYGPDFSATDHYSLQRSTDSGATWTRLNLPFAPADFAPDPVRAGYLYALSSAADGARTLKFYRSTDFGASWQGSDFLSYQYSRIAVDPAHPDIVLAGPLRSTDGGRTWKRNPASRPITAAFAPATKGLAYASASESSDLYLAHYDADGKTLRYATYLGGMGNETGASIARGPAGDVWVAGTTTSADLPVTADALQPQPAGDSDIFLARFSAEGVLLYCSYLGGTGGDSLRGIASDSAGNVWLTGTTSTLDFPITTGVVPSPGPYFPANRIFVARASAAGNLAYASYFGGSDYDIVGGITVDPADNVILTGTALSPDFPAVGAAVRSASVPSRVTPRVFLAKLDPAGSLAFSTYFGGSIPAQTRDGSTSGNQGASAVAVDSAGNIYVAGTTSMTDFPVTANAYQPALHGGCPYPAFAIATGMIGTIYRYLDDDVFVTKLNSDASRMLYSTYVGGSCYDRATGLTVGADGAAYVTGESDSWDLPRVAPFESAPLRQSYKSFVFALDPTGAQLTLSSALAAGTAPAPALSPATKLRVAGTSGAFAQTAQNSGGLFLSPGPPDPSLFSHAALYTIDLAAPLPPLKFDDIANGFSFESGPVVPGEIVMLSAPNLPAEASADVGLAGASQLSDTLAGVRVLFDGQPAQVMSAGAGRIFAITPSSLKPASTTVVHVEYQDQRSNELRVPVVDFAPGMLSLDGSGSGRANARNEDGSLNAPDNPAPRGSSLTFYFTGVPPGTGTIFTSLGQAAVAPLSGFVPGIYSGRVAISTTTSYPAEFQLAIYAGQTTGVGLKVYIK